MTVLPVIAHSTLRLTACLAVITLLAACGAPETEAPRACLEIAAPAPDAPQDGMVWIAPGEVTLGSQDFYPEERPVRTVAVEGFWIAAHAVTNAEFAAFAEATGYVTLAERAGPDTGGGAVFGPGVQVRDWSDIRAWWRYDPQASWHQPRGAGSTIDGRGAFPVVQIAYEDALAYARWRGHDLPGEAEWERAARGGLEGAVYVWGDEARPGGAGAPITGRARFRSRTAARTVSPAWRPWAAIRPMISACTTWPAMSGNGPAIRGSAAASA